MGKTCLLIRYTSDKFPVDYLPTAAFDDYYKDLEINNKLVSLHLKEAAGKDYYDDFRRLVYQDLDVLLVCFSVVCPASFENVRKKWHPEVTHFCPKIPVILVGTKSDLRDDSTELASLKSNNLLPISYKQGLQMQESVGAVKYFECSALTDQGVQELFNATIRIILDERKKRKRLSGKCNIF